MVSENYAIEVSQAADEDFRVALAYYLQVAGKLSAEKFIARYEDVLAYLETVPIAAAKIGSTGYHWLPVRSHVLVYRIDEKDSKVYLVRMHYGSSNWRKELEEEYPLESVPRASQDHEKEDRGAEHQRDGQHR